MTIHRATRTGVRPLIGLFSESGCGKTYSALLLARGFVGPKGKICIVDSEAGRASLYADIPEIGGYDALDLSAPYSPQHYIEAISEVESAGYSIGIIDSASHEWEAEKGILDMAMENEERTGKAGLHCWKQPKLDHAKFVLRLLQSPIPWIICLRAKHKSRQTRENGKTQIVRDEFTSPIQADDFIFEITCHGEIMPDHSFRLTKASHPVLRDCFPKSGPITVKTGEAVAQWCREPSGNTTPLPTVDPKVGPSEPPKDYKGDSNSTVAKRKALGRKLWDMTRDITLVEKKNDKDSDKCKAGLKFLNQWLIDEGVMTERETLEELGLDRMTEVVDSVQKKMEAK